MSFLRTSGTLGKRQRRDSEDLESFRSGGLFVTPPPPLARSSAGPFERTTSPVDSTSGESQLSEHHEAHQDIDEESDDEEEAGYDDSEETLPQHPAFDPKIGDLLQQAADLMSMLKSIIEKYNNDSEDLQTMFQRAAKAMEVPETKPKIVGLLGDTGSGKSSTVNSLASIFGLAKAVAAGESCTKVIMLYQHILEGQQSPFAAEIRYSNLETCARLLQEQYYRYTVYNFEFNDDWADGDKKDYEQKSRTAFKIFCSLFCNREEFESPRAGREYLDQAYKQASHAVETMTGWCREHLGEYELQDGSAVLHFEAETAESLNDQLSPYISEHHQVDEPTLCHLVEKVSIGAPSSRLLQYITIADLPGKHNPTHLKIAHVADKNRDKRHRLCQSRHCP